MKNLIITTCLGIAMLYFLGCSKKSGSAPVTKTAIEGKWTEDSVTIITYKDSKITNTYKESTPDGTYDQFNSDGTGIEYFPAYQTYPATSLHITYKLSGTNLSLTYPNYDIDGTAIEAGTDLWTILTLNEHTLAIRYSDNGTDVSNNAIVQYFYYSK